MGAFATVAAAPPWPVETFGKNGRLISESFIHLILSQSVDLEGQSTESGTPEVSAQEVSAPEVGAPEVSAPEAGS